MTSLPQKCSNAHLNSLQAHQTPGWGLGFFVHTVMTCENVKLPVDHMQNTILAQACSGISILMVIIYLVLNNHYRKPQ